MLAFALVGSVSLYVASLPLALGAAVVVLTIVLLAWNASAIRGYTQPGAVVFSRKPWVVLVGGLVLIACAAATLFIAPDQSDILLLPVIFAALFWAGWMPSTLLFWMADESGLTRQWLSFKTTLPWHEIDWAYSTRKKTNYTAYGIIKVAQSTEEFITVEAGPRRRIKIALKAPLVGGNAMPLLAVIRQRATYAYFGMEAAPQVRERRFAGMQSYRG